MSTNTKSSDSNRFAVSSFSNVLGGMLWTRVFFVITLLVLLVGPYFGPVPAHLHNRMAIEPSVIWLLVGFLLSFSVITIVALRLDGKRFAEIGEWVYELGLGKPTRISAAIVGGVIGVAWAALMLMATLQFNPDANVLAISGFRLLAAGLATIGTVLEDLLTRGFVMNRLNQMAAPKWAQLCLSALVFALYHTIWAFNPGSFISSVVYGLILSGLYLWGKRSLTPVILAHALVVLLAEPFATMLIFLVPSL